MTFAVPDLFIPGATLGLGLPGGWEWAGIILVGLLLFGRRLPEVGRNVGKAIIEFKKGIKDVKDEVESGMAQAERESSDVRRSEPARLSETSRGVSTSDGMSESGASSSGDDRRVSRSEPVPSTPAESV